MFLFLTLEVFKLIYNYFYFYFIYLLAAPTACGSFWARDQTHTTTVIRATAVTTPDP